MREREISPSAACTSLLLTAALLAPGCGALTYDDKVAEQTLPDTWQAAAAQTTLVDEAPSGGFCGETFGAEYAELVDRGLAANRDLAAAVARIEQARAGLRLARAPLMPSAEASAGISRSRGFVPPPIPITTNTDYTASVAASYEVDVWGRAREELAAARANEEVLRLDASAIAVSIAAQLAEAWTELGHQRELRALLTAQIATAEELLEITRIRFETGMASELDVRQQEAQIEALRSQLPRISSQIAIQRHRIAVLLGAMPGSVEVDGPSTLPDVGALPALGVPAELLEARPDVASAQRRLESANARAAAAVRAQLPRVRLSAALNLQSRNEISSLFDNLFFNLGANAAQTLFSGGRLRAEADRTEAVAIERLEQLQQSVLRAIEEVENALVLEEGQRAQIAQLQRQLESAASALDTAWERYRFGQLDYLRVLNSQQAVEQAQQSLLGARRQLVSYRIQLCRSLGGNGVGEELAAEDSP